MGYGDSLMNTTLALRPSARTITASFALGMGVVLLAGCAPLVTSEAPAADTTAVNFDDSRNYLFNAVESRFDSTETVVVEESLEDLLPSQEFSVEGSEAQSLAGGIVFGTITDVAPGVSYTINPDDELNDVELPFDSPEAMWRVAVLTIDIDNALGEEVDSDRTVTVGYVIDATLNLDLALDGFDKLNGVALVLNRPGKFEFDESLYSVRWSGALLGEVSSENEISFPGLGDESDEFVGELTTVDAVVKADKKRKKVVKVDVEQNQYVRSDR